ncbi:E3 ubiquitin ligase PQT3-like isoform X2 [Aristolochia californica]|uniref:E3 ubiquitin ligase PQT3-like isoform X2 n=1 Tax=Aristolochia californica TaxID=171875 RepID=UPI0035DF7638
MAVYYKFKSAKDYDSVHIDGHFISVAILKEKIFESKHLGRGTDFDLMVSNAQTNEEYADDAMLIPKNTSVLVRRVPGRPRMPIVTEIDEPQGLVNKVEETPPPKSVSIAETSAVKFPEESEWDEFGNDLYAIPEVLPVQSGNLLQDAPPTNKADEDSKIKALIDTSALDWQRQSQEGFGPGRGFGRGMGGRMIAGRGFGRGGGGGLERKTPPQGYICHRCKVPGHFIQHCPTNGDPNYDIKRVKPPTGIPKSMLMATPDGSYALPSGAVAVLKPNEAAFEKEIDGFPTTRSVSELPPELRCPLCKEVMKDAVLTGKCCFNSFCDKCIRDHIISKAVCVCGATNILADDLLPNKTLRETINRIMESTTSSAENAGSQLQVQDMESARFPQPKAPSPILSAGRTLSAVLKDQNLPPHTVEALEPKEPANEDKVVVNVAQHSVEKSKATKVPDVSEATLESVKEPTSQGSAPLPEEEVQQKLPTGEPVKKKKKKKLRAPASSVDLPWRTPQDLAAENYAMSFGASAYNPYWSGGMQWGTDGLMGPYGGAMPYMGYTPGPFDLPFGGFMPQDPFGGQGYNMMPVVPPQRGLAEFGMGSTPVPPVMSREEFEARKADLRRRHEIERRGERESSRDEKVSSREISRSGDVSSVKPKPRLMPQTSGPDHRSEKRPTSDRPREADLSRSSLPRPPKRKHQSDHHEEVLPPPSGPDSKLDPTLKASVFARISFPESGADGSSKKRKTAAETTGSNGYKEREPPRSLSNGYHHRDEHKSSKAVVAAAVSTRKSSPYEQESSDEDYHFKRRRPSRHESVEPRASRGSREYERERGGKHR